MSSSELGTHTPRPESKAISLEKLAEHLDGSIEGDPTTSIIGVANLDDAAPGFLIRVEHPRYLSRALATPASALLGGLDLPAVARPVIRVENVRRAFLLCLAWFDLEALPAPGIHATAVIADDAEIGADCSIGAYSVIASGAVVGRGVIVQPHVVVGEQAVVGDGAVLFPHVVLYPRTRVGQRVRIHSGSVIGCDGYGYEWTGSAHLKRPHNGRVRIEDDVEIGANVTIDRATTGETVIGPGTKIDNLVQIAHNVRTGAHCLVVSQVGIAGSARLGNGVVLAGQAGVNTHAEVGDGAQVGAGSGIWGKAPPGSFLSGNPARPHREELRIQAALGRLPELLRRVKELERRLEAAGVRSEGGPSDDVG